MKPESVKSILLNYLREKRNSSGYDECDGISRHQNYREQLAESFISLENPQPTLNTNAPLSREGEVIARGIGRQLSTMSDCFELHFPKNLENQACAIGSKVLQFKHRCTFVAPNCGHTEIHIVRTGTADQTARVAWRTIDKTAKAGTHYIGSRGNLSFAEGDTEKTIEVEIIRNRADNDVCFTVELYDPEGIDVGPVNPLNVYISDHSSFYDDEKQVVENLLNCGPNASVSSILSCCLENVSVNTFKTALQCMCSNANSIPEELAFASELVRLTMHTAPLETLSNIMCNFFRHLPELEDIVQYFDDIN